VSAPDRVELIRLSSTLTGIDFVQVSPDQLELFVFVHHLTLPASLDTALSAITPTQVSIDAIGQTTPAHVPVVQHVLPIVSVNGRRALHFKVAAPGGFGYYRLRIDDPAIDTYFNDVRFSFKANCPSELDCKAKDHECPPDDRVDFPVDYRARDFWSFRQALIDFAAQRYPDWQDRLEADIGMMLVELMSAVGDELSYANDRIAREQTLGEASQRRSLHHLAGLVDYRLDEGRGAFAWLDVQANAAGTLTGGDGVTDARHQVTFEIGRGLADEGKLFAVSPARNAFTPYLWDEDDVCLPAQSSTLTLTGHHAIEFVPDISIDEIGKWVLLATVPTDPAKPERRLTVRVTEATDTADPLNGNAITQITWDEPTPYELDLDTLVVRGNLVPSTSGRTQKLSFRIGPPPVGGPVLPSALERVGANHDLTDAPDATVDEDEIDAPPLARRVKHLFSLPDSDKVPLVWLPDASGEMAPEIRLNPQGAATWDWMPALIGAEVASVTDEAFTLENGTYRTVFVAERPAAPPFEFADYASDAGHTIRFGDGEFGVAPADGTVFDLAYRLGNGRLMNVAADTLTRFALTAPGFVDSIVNPLAATGGRDPETDTSIRTNAPQAFRYRPLRAVQPKDYEEIAERLDWVQKAGATPRWTGSWAAMFATADPRDEFGLSRPHREELEATLDRVRQAGRDVRIQEPRYADIDLEIEICVAPEAYAGEVKERVLVALFGARDTAGFFDPDNFTFGTPLARGALLAAIQDVIGVRAVERMRVRRRGHFKWRPFNEFALRVGHNELIRVTNDRLLPERGAVRLVMEGGA
jgi:hypothetical protein